MAMTAWAAPASRAIVAKCRLSGCDKPVFVEYRTQIAHDYCCRTHAEQDLRRTVIPHGSCHECKLDGCHKTVYFDRRTGRTHDFCCKRHAEHAIHLQTWKVPTGYVSSASSASASQQCALPGCSRPRWNDPHNNRIFSYCGNSHRKLAEQRKLLPPDGPAVYKSFRGPGGYTVNMLQNTHTKYQDIKQQFYLGWKHPTKRQPVVYRIYQIKLANTLYQRYCAFATHRGKHTEVRRFHGTSMHTSCKIGIDENQAPCENRDCSVCNICREGFSMGLSGSATGGKAGWLRFGPGLYFSKTSSKSDDYAASSERKAAGKTFRCMFLCKVSMGRAFRTKKDMRSLKGPPHGYNSVSGEVGEDLNYDELVVYDNKAALPSYLIVYRVA